MLLGSKVATEPPNVAEVGAGQSRVAGAQESRHWASVWLRRDVRVRRKKLKRQDVMVKKTGRSRKHIEWFIACCEVPSVASCLVQKEVEGSHLQVHGEARAIEARGKKLPSLIFSTSESFLFNDSLPSADNASWSKNTIDCNDLKSTHTYTFFLVIKEFDTLSVKCTVYSNEPVRCTCKI